MYQPIHFERLAQMKRAELMRQAEQERLARLVQPDRPPSERKPFLERARLWVASHLRPLDLRSGREAECPTCP
jgi:hypothetical protein